MIARWRVAAAAGVAAVLVLGAGCAGPRSGTSATSDRGVCASVLPAARDAVHDRGQLVVVRPLRRGQAGRIIRAAGGMPLARPSPHPEPPGAATSSAQPGMPRSCLVVYRGDYPAGSIAASPAGHGRYAVIVLGVRHATVLRVLLVDALPPAVRR